MSKEKEIRRLAVKELVEVRSEDDEAPKKLRGYAAVFDQEIDIWGMFRETIRKGAFTRALKEKHDVRALIDHDASKVLGRSVSGTLEMKEDDKGLYVEITPPDTQVANDLLKLVERGDVNQMSFGFIPTTVTWREEEGKSDLREIEDLDLFDVSVVTYPAYDQTEVSLRSAQEILKTERPEVLMNDTLKRKIDLALLD